jgi:RNA polymerase sigma-54 factor
MLKDHFPLFAQRRVQALASATGRPLADVERACEQLKRLNPKPGCAFVSEVCASVIPDLVIHKREQHYDVELNDEDIPHVTMNRSYYRMLKDPSTPLEAKDFLQNKFRQASWVIKAIDERNATLLAIARCLISLQRDFVEDGPQALKPLTQAQVADLIGRHPSTVSRAIAGKTIDTPYGVFRLEQFFASNVPQSDAQRTVSDESIKSEIKRLVEEEGERPLSDEAITHRLAECHISVARRTIAKYRTSLKILPAHLRKRRL